VSASERLLASFYGLTVVPDQRKVTGHSTSDATLRFTGQARAASSSTPSGSRSFGIGIHTSTAMRRQRARVTPEGEGQALSFVVRRAALAFR
jgi:hypothetical protein